MLSCDCNYESADWYYYVPDDFTTLDTNRRKRCCSCKVLMYKKAQCLKFDRAREPSCDIEERIYGDEVVLAPWFMCEFCGEIFLNLSELGYCHYLGSNPIKEDLEEYWTVTGFVPKENKNGFT